MKSHSPKTVRCHGKSYRVQGEIIIRRRSWLLLQLLSRRGRGRLAPGNVEPDCDERWLVMDARRHALDGPCSLQVLPHRLSPQRLRVLRQLAGFNPFAASVIDCECRSDVTLIVWQWIPGMSLTDWLQQQSTSRRRISLHECLRLYRGLVRTISGFHRVTGLVHGDIHPDNIVLGSRSRWLMLIDYGSACRSLESVTERQTQGCRPLWAAPEINAGDIGDQRADQFSATLVLFAMLTGELPFDRLGGRVGGHVNPQDDPFWEPPVSVIQTRYPLSKTKCCALSDFLAQTISIGPEGRFETNSHWMQATDRLLSDFDGRHAHGSLFDRLIVALRSIYNGATGNGSV